MRQIWHQLFIAGILFISQINGAIARDLTGQYESPPVKGCSVKLITNEDLGLTYKWHCFTGNAYGYSRALSLVQNGNKFCGNYFECVGWDCNKIYGGPLAGNLAGDKLVIYYATGHLGNTEAEQQSFSVVEGGLALTNKKTKDPDLILRSTKMKFPLSKKLCDPQIPEKVLLNENGELQVSGILKEEETPFRNLKQARFARPPLPARIDLSKKSIDFVWTDSRPNRNTVIREINVINQSRKMWVVSAAHDQSCRDFLGSYYHEKFRMPLPQTKDFRANGDLELKPNQSIRADSCLGSQWHFKIDAKPLKCPPFQCLEGCKC